VLCACLPPDLAVLIGIDTVNDLRRQHDELPCQWRGFDCRFGGTNFPRGRNRLVGPLDDIGQRRGKIEVLPRSISRHLANIFSMMCSRGSKAWPGSSRPSR
jgi:hypothetical protein